MNNKIPDDLNNRFTGGLAQRFSEIEAAWKKLNESVEARKEPAAFEKLLRYKLIKLSDASKMYGYIDLHKEAWTLLQLIDAAQNQAGKSLANYQQQLEAGVKKLEVFIKKKSE